MICAVAIVAIFQDGVKIGNACEFVVCVCVCVCVWGLAFASAGVLPLSAAAEQKGSSLRGSPLLPSGRAQQRPPPPTPPSHPPAHWPPTLTIADGLAVVTVMVLDTALLVRQRVLVVAGWASLGHPWHPPRPHGFVPRTTPRDPPPPHPPTHMQSIVMLVSWNVRPVLVAAFWLFYTFVTGAYLSSNLVKAGSALCFAVSAPCRPVAPMLCRICVAINPAEPAPLRVPSTPPTTHAQCRCRRVRGSAWRWRACSA